MNPPPTDHPERRSEPRHRAVRMIEILPCRAAAEWKFLPAELTDCSRHGIGMLLSQPIELGQQFLLKLRTPAGLRMLLYTVASCVKAQRSRWRIGARFSSMVTERFDENPQVIVDAFIAGR